MGSFELPPTGFFERVALVPPDAIFELTKQYNADASESKVNLGQGTYKDSSGEPWILPAVQAAKEEIRRANHEYLPILGLASFRHLATKLVLGESSPAVVEQRVASCQTLSGTGALHQAGLVLYEALGPSCTVYITEPTWSNHRQVFEAIGFHVQSYRYYDEATGKLDVTSLEQTLEAAAPGSIFVMHACAHNPSGCDPTQEQWRRLATIAKSRNLFPLFDAAYLGITSGDYDTDAFAIRHFVNDVGIEAAVCTSFAKNMGLYGERVGLVNFITQTPEAAIAVESKLAQLTRVEISNPPAFGARIVAAVLGDDELRAEWFRNLSTMSGRIAEMRQRLYDALVRLKTPGDWERIIQQKGMFCILGLPLARVLQLKGKQLSFAIRISKPTLTVAYDWRELRETWMMQSWLLHIVYGAFTEDVAQAERISKMLRTIVDSVRDLGFLKQVVATLTGSPVWLQAGTQDPVASQPVDVSDQWRTYIGEESLKLCIYTVLLLDHHIFSCSNIRPLLSTMECLWELPLAASLWEAENAGVWYEIRCHNHGDSVPGTSQIGETPFKGFLSTATQSLLSEMPDPKLITMLAGSPFAMMCTLTNLDALVKDFTRCYYQLPPSPADPSAFHILTQSQTRQVCSALSVLFEVVNERLGAAILEPEQSVWHACQVLIWSIKLSLCRPDDLLVGGIVENRVYASLVTATHLTMGS
ncbi:putative secondary metabolism biosynthetic enzyme [Paraconiothyrium brasiliense]|uniref:Aspartate aminotransferase n=1 Tax=Paraconiothyrium brasiliense TaxID=300254 RepID=A0ABR3R4V6_9PLEO